jgi:hypothetical protein
MELVIHITVVGMYFMLPGEYKNEKRRYIFYCGKGRQNHSFRNGFIGKKYLETADKKEAFN